MKCKSVDKLQSIYKKESGDSVRLALIMSMKSQENYFQLQAKFQKLLRFYFQQRSERMKRV